mmetsp:Transcript_26062/g.60738  ORF Transcript_26062/g.60738 Transcript_26062/m.60738 type:complete len:228 (-) Transcript_26062:213-896(-)
MASQCLSGLSIRMGWCVSPWSTTKGITSIWHVWSSQRASQWKWSGDRGTWGRVPWSTRASPCPGRLVARMGTAGGLTGTLTTTTGSTLSRTGAHPCPWTICSSTRRSRRRGSRMRRSRPARGARSQTRRSSAARLFSVELHGLWRLPCSTAASWMHALEGRRQLRLRLQLPSRSRASWRPQDPQRAGTTGVRARAATRAARRGVLPALRSGCSPTTPKSTAPPRSWP